MKIIDLDIDAFLSGDTKIEEIGLVFSPAIEQDWVYFNSSEQQFESYNDYPQSASDAACRAVRYAEENGWGSCGTDVGKRRASQLCNRENISEETISRMAGFERHRQNKDTPYGEGCGKLMWDSWGGDTGIAWSQRKLEQIKKERMSSQCGCSITEDFVDSAQGISVGDYVSWTYAGRGDDADRGRGQVKDIRVEGEVKIPDTDLTLTATEDKPVALIETKDGKIVGQYIDGDMRVTQKPEDFNEDQDMIDGIVDLLLQVEDIENRALMAIQVLKDFENDDIDYDFDVFLERIGLGGPDLAYLWDDTVELEDLLDMGYVITEAKEIDPSEIVSEYKETFSEKKITEEQFYRLSSKPNEPSLLDSPFRLRRYVYSIGPQGGPDLISTSRQFCRRMMGKRQLVWRFEDINLLSTQLNSEDRDYKIIPRPKGASVNCWLYAGGANCRHRWTELSLSPGDRVKNNKQIAEQDAIISMDAPGQAGKLNEVPQYNRQRNPSTLREESMSTQKFNIIGDVDGEPVYSTEEEALQRASELGCEGTHRHGEGFMACSSHGDVPVGFLQGVPVYETEQEAKSKSQAMGCEGIYEKVDYMGKESFRPCRSRNSNEFSSKNYEFKTDEEKRMIYAPAMIPNKLIRRYEPGEGEYFVRFSREAIERGAYKYLAEGRTTPEFVNYEHSDKKFDDIYLVESWIVGDEQDKIYEYGFTQEQVPSGSWVVGYKVSNDELWNEYVKKGLIKAVSVEGLFDMSFSKHKTDEYLLNEVINIITQIK